MVGLYDMVVADIKAGNFAYDKPENVPLEIMATVQDVADIVRQSNLGRDPAKNGGKWNGAKSAAETQTGLKLEQKLGQQITRDPSGAGDWIDKAGKIYDAVGSDLTRRYFGNGKLFFASIKNHLINKTNVDFIVVDIAKLSKRQQRKVVSYINSLQNNLRDRIITFRK